MICCKIITNFKAEAERFISLCSLLEKKGSWLWDGYNLFFADIEGSTDEKTVKRLVKKAGFTSFYIEVYDAYNEPHDNEEIKSWVADKLCKIYYKKFEDDNQQGLQEIKEGLTQLNDEVRQMIKKAHEQKTKSKKKPKSKKDGG